MKIIYSQIYSSIFMNLLLYLLLLSALSIDYEVLSVSLLNKCSCALLTTSPYHALLFDFDCLNHLEKTSIRFDYMRLYSDI